MLGAVKGKGERELGRCSPTPHQSAGPSGRPLHGNVTVTLLGKLRFGSPRRLNDSDNVAIDRVTTRHVQGAPLSDLQMVQGHIADMAVDVDASALLIYRAAWAKDSGAPRVTREAAMAKLFATDHAQQVIDKAVQLHGGDGVRHGEKVESLYREIRALRIYEGASDVQRVVIARQTLGAR